MISRGKVTAGAGAGVGATATGQPHWLQNFAPADSPCPHWWHWRGSAVPQASQNLAVCEFAWLQCGQSMAVSVRPAVGRRKRTRGADLAYDGIPMPPEIQK
jgi:hypothetical protein